MTFRAVFIGPDQLMRTERFILADVTEQGTHYFLPDGQSVYYALAGTLPPADVKTEWHIPNEALGVLLAALQNHLGGVDVTSAMRKDYEREQARVDRMLDTISNIALGHGSNA